MRDDFLFSRGDLSGFMEERRAAMKSGIDSLDRNRLLNASPDDFCEHFVSQYTLAAPVLLEDSITIDSKETYVDVMDFGNMIRVPGLKVSCYVPFEGDPDLFHYCPSSYTTAFPRGEVIGSELVMSWGISDHDDAKLKSSLERELGGLRQWLQWVAADVATYNASLPGIGRDRIGSRRQKILKDKGLVASLGFPLRRRENAPATYSVPVARKKLVPKTPVASAHLFRPEPTLEMADYEQILSVISDMAIVIERNPFAFKGMKEEYLRTQFLIPLNALFEGKATGETFNCGGKTDILIRDEGKNIFIAECKFWRGAESLKKAVDQLLGYTSWRDTKTALIVFNKGGNLTSVMDKAKEGLQAHPQWKRGLAYTFETGFRCVLRNRDDADREIILTVMFFNVPGDGSKGGVL